MPKGGRIGRERGTEGALVREFREEDAPGLARMFNESDEGWPGGLTRGIPETPARVLREITRSSTFARLVVDIKGEIIGYCTVGKHWRDKDAAYVGFLNVTPRHHGRGFGRRLLLKGIEEATKRGLKRIDLHTWSGNMKAVPLYKKTGFFWVPDTNVYMQNYIPQILTFPIAKDFFDRHPDWYHSFDRELEVKEDDFKLDDMKIFPYKWAAKGDKLKVVIDREAHDITGIETNDLEVRCWVDEQEAPAGIPLKMHWRITNRMRRKISCSLLLQPDEGIDFLEEPPKSFIVGSRGSRELEGRLIIDPGIEGRDEDETSHKVRSNLILDGRLITMATGLRVKQPIELTFDPEYLVGRPGSKDSLMINVRNRLRKGVKGEILAVASDGVHMAPSAANFEVDSKGIAGAEFQIHLSREVGTRALPITFLPSISLNGTKVSAKPTTYHVKCVDEGGIVSSLEDDKELVLTSQALTVSLTLKGGHVGVRDNISDMGIFYGFQDSLGPPFWPPEFSMQKYQYELEHVEGALRAKLYVDSKAYPGIRMVKQITLAGGSPIIKVAYSLINNSSSKYDLKLQVRSYASIPDAVLTIPLKEGFVRAAISEGDFPQWEGDAPERPEQIEESWSCFEQPRQGLAAGLIWNRLDIVENSFGGTKMPELIIDIPDLQPQSTRNLSPLYVFCGYGDWKTVREYYGRLIEGKVRGEVRYHRPHTRPPIDVIAKPSPIALNAHEEANVTLGMSISRMKPLSGKVKVVQPAGWEAKLDRDSFEGIKRSDEMNFVLSLKPPTTTSLGCYKGRIVLELPERDYNFPLDILIVGKGGEVRAREGEEGGMGVMSMDNGLYVFKASPDFAGTLYSATEKDTGKNHLFSSFPKPKPLVFLNPWHGGIRTLIFKGRYPGKAHEEKWRGRRAEIGPWKGIVISTTLTDINEDLKRLEAGVYYLTRPNSNILAIVNEYHNTTSATLSFTSGLMMFLQLGGSLEKYAIIAPGRRKEYLRRGTRYSHFASTDQGYAVVTNQETGDSLCLASTQSERSAIEILDMAQYGGHLTSYTDIYLKPNETRKFVNYVVFAKTKEEALKYRILRSYQL
jgi:ribosomal protein S18 acetylase RimI-like enzyme